MKKIDITGKKFNRWTALYEVQSGKNSLWFCKCDCGNCKTVDKMSIMHGKSKSCGCLQAELNRERYQTPIETVYKEIYEKGYTFIEWVEIYKDAKSRVKLKNKIGVEFITTMDVIRRNIGKGNQLNDNRNSCNGVDVYDEFVKRGLIPMFKPEEYINIIQLLPYICPDHKDKGIQYKTYDVLRHAANKCKYCYYDQYHGLFDMKVYKFLRIGAKEWRKSTITLCSNKCILTASKLNDIHHLYGFTKICQEVFEISNLEIYKDLNNYSQEESIVLLDICKSLHLEHGLGIGLCKPIHQLFHSTFGMKNNTPQQFKEFITRLEIGEFNNFLKENNLELSINYEVLNKVLK